MTDFEKRITFPRAAFERRHDDPSRDFGVGCVVAQFALIGVWELMQEWYEEHLSEAARV